MNFCGATEPSLLKLAELLLAAARRDDVDEVARLLTERRDPDLRDDDGSTALHYAARIGSMRLTECLLWFGAAPDVREAARFGGATPFAVASDAGHLELADALAEAGADVNVQSSLDGATPLHRAARRGDCSMVKLLLSFGADTGLRDNAGNNASQWAHCAGFRDVLFIVGMPPPSKPLVEEIVTSSLVVLQQNSLLEQAAGKAAPKKKKKAGKKKK